MRIVGAQNRSEIELDPQQAYRRGRELDALLRRAAPPAKEGKEGLEVQQIQARTSRPSGRRGAGAGSAA